MSLKTKQIRPYFACAVLRNVKFTPRSYTSFIDLQEKLHQNLCRRRQLVAIGTHDLDTIKPQFRYEARPPQSIRFVPLGKDKVYNAEELMTIYEVRPFNYFAFFLHSVNACSPKNTWQSICPSSATLQSIQSYTTPRTTSYLCLLSSIRNLARLL